MRTPIVISASRRTDLVGCYPDQLIECLKKYPPDAVHTLVIWTKNPLPLFTHKRLYKTIRQYKQIYIHLTVTGMGGSIFEPHIPESKNVVKKVSHLIDCTGSPDRIIWRFDPIVHFTQGRTVYSNLSFFKPLARAFSRQGISLIKVSWVTPYKKVIRHLERIGWDVLELPLTEKKKQARVLEETARDLDMRIEYCCVEGFPSSRCIDGYRFNELLPDERSCSVRRARGQRPLCGCTASLDIGWYSQVCPHGCVYCYAHPLV